MWRLSHILCHLQLWFSDGRPLQVERGLFMGDSSRLIVDGQGFLDLTTTQSPNDEIWEISANDATLWMKKSELSDARCPSLHSISDSVRLALKIDGSGGFDLSAEVPQILVDCYDTSGNVSGSLKELPDIAADDVEFIDGMIEQGYVPYQNIPESPGKSMDEIKALGERFFPFTPYSFQLALCVYDWTTASFTRLVLMKIFEYTGIAPAPFPFDRDSVAEQIWASNWSSYTPQDVDYMRSFLMEPAYSLEDVYSQLDRVGDQLQRFSDVQNRLLSVALESLPRTSILSSSVLFSGQMDISQLGLDHFGVEFLECPLNEGPVGETLVSPLDDVLSTYISVGRTITTKMAWSFTDSIDDALHYSNGILLVLNPSGNSWVWDELAFITSLSDDPGKNEYVAAPRTEFEVMSVDSTTVLDKKTIVITLQPV